jgi:hypothetical protein
MSVINRLALHNLGKYGEASVTSCKFDIRGWEALQIKFQVMLTVESRGWCCGPLMMSQEYM